jgi:uncharacterized protein YutE (UPF0331/DUF86 family)
MSKARMPTDRVTAEINAELAGLKRLQDELRQLNDTCDTTNRFILRAQASIIADFYSGIERALKIIAQELTGSTPRGEDWHKRLLTDATLEIGERGPVIPQDLYEQLLPYLGFRHVFRNAYGFDLDVARLRILADNLSPTCDSFAAAVRAFLEDLAQ